jgi:transformation/transcription domain-associated protein
MSFTYFVSFLNSTRPTLESEVQSFLDIVLKIYNELPNTVKLTLSDKAPAAGQSSSMHMGPLSAGGPASSPPQSNNIMSSMGAAPGAEGGKPTTLVRSMQSFKVLTECPIIVVLLFQLYPRFLQVNIPKFMPMIVQALSLQAPSGAYLRHRASYVDFIAAQVKTLSFLAYLLRGFAEHLRPYQSEIPKYAIQLLLNCPNESASTRKELLIATRHILATDFRVGFISQIDTLLDETVLIGTGRTSYETLR